MNEEIRDAEKALDRTFSQLSKLPSSAPLSKRKAAESDYARVYDSLVRMGARPRLRTKYRVR